MVVHRLFRVVDGGDERLLLLDRLIELLDHLLGVNGGGDGVLPGRPRLLQGVSGLGDDIALLDLCHERLRRDHGGGEFVVCLVHGVDLLLERLDECLGLFRGVLLGGEVLLHSLEIALELRDERLVHGVGVAGILELLLEVIHVLLRLVLGVDECLSLLHLPFDLVVLLLGLIQRSLCLGKVVEGAHELLGGNRLRNGVLVRLLGIRQLVGERKHRLVRLPRLCLGLSKILAQDLSCRDLLRSGSAGELRRGGDCGNQLRLEIGGVLVHLRGGFVRRVQLIAQVARLCLGLRSFELRLLPGVGARIVAHRRLDLGLLDGQVFFLGFHGGLGRRFPPGQGRRGRRRRRGGRRVARVRVRVEGDRCARVHVHELLEAVVQGNLAQLLRLAG